jgi:uncharacterized protein (TIGR02145 family)
MDFEVGTYPTNAGTVAYLYPQGAFTVDSESSQIQSNNLLNATQAQPNNTVAPNHLSAKNWMYSKAVAPGADFTLQPMGAILRFALTFPTAVKGGTITLSSDKASFIQSVQIAYSGETASVSVTKTDYSQSLTIAKGEPNNSIVAYMMVAAVDGFIGLNSATLTLIAELSDPSGTSTNTYAAKLGTTKSDANWEAGKCYNFTATLAKVETVWAASNIYWDGSKLTFDVVGTTNTNPYRQGVYFKWGSLVGISPALTSDNGTEAGTKKNSWTGYEMIYVPKYDSSSSTWDWDDEKTATAAGYTGTGTTGYSKIPYESADDLSTGADVNSLNDTQWAAKKGDICRFLGETNPNLAGYRMPRAEEFGASTDWTRNTAADWNVNLALGKDDGTSDLTGKGYATWNATGAIFPAAGYRSQSGTLNQVGEGGRFWSSSAYDATKGYNLSFNENGVLPSSNYNRPISLPVRCVKN